MSAPKGLEQLLDELIAREGGYVDHPADRGGPTNFGITEQVARAHGYVGAMKLLPKELARSIYRQMYWVRPGLGDVAQRMPRLAAELFDTGVNMGPKRAGTFLQRALNAFNNHAKDYPDIGVDGDVGPLTILQLDRLMIRRGPLAETVLLRAVECLQGDFYLELAERDPSQEAFAVGWFANRIGNGVQ